MENNSPKGWIELAIKDFAFTASGGTPSTSKKEYWENGNVPWINSGALKDDEINEPSHYITELGLNNSSAKLFPEQSVVIALTGATTGRIGLLNIETSTNQSVTGIFPSKYVLPRYIFYFLKSYRDELLHQSLGSAQPHINKAIVDNIVLPVAPLPEQQRIVEKLDALMARISNSKTRLEKIPTLLKNFRQSVLAAAVSGELTKEWREENEATAVEDIIQQIKKKRIENAKSESKKKEIKEIYDSNDEGNHFELPNEWRFISLDKICDSFQYGSSQKSDNQGLVPVLRMGNLQNGKIDWSDLKYSSDNDEIEKYFLEENDILFNRTNSPELVGKTSIYKGEKEAIFAGYLIRVKYLPEVSPDYLNYCLNTPYAKEWCQFAKTDGVSQSNINAQKLAKFEMPFCSVQEQKEIVRKVEELFHFADSIEARYQKAKAWFDKLPQAILAKAFRGELVPQDENDEPASVLLERIKNEKLKKQKSGTQKPKDKKGKMYKNSGQHRLVGE